MRLAWFGPDAAADAHPFDDTLGLIRALGAHHEIRTFSRTNAYDFPWTHFRAPYDVCVFDLDNTTAHGFVWPYLLHYGGVLLLRTRTLHDSRARQLVHTGRLDDYVAEFGFNEGHAPYPGRAGDYIRSNEWAMLRAPLLAARLVVLPHQGVAEALQNEYPDVRIRHAPLPVQDARWGGEEALEQADIAFGIVSTDRVDVARRAVDHARRRGAAASLIIDSAERIVRSAEVVLVLQRPAFGKPRTLAVAAMSGAKPVVVLETDASADWPLLDPQTWQPRGRDRGAPVGVSLDLRDEEHSLMLSVRRLSDDAAFRNDLGEGGRAWWSAHATVEHAVEAWNDILNEAAAVNRAERPPNWPAHLDADGTARAREILADFGVNVDPRELFREL